MELEFLMVPSAPPPPPTAPYSHAVRAGELLFVTGVYASYFEAGRFPGRTCVGVTGLALGGLVEIDLIVRP